MEVFVVLQGMVSSSELGWITRRLPSDLQIKKATVE
jgi:hypothetical protein